MIGQIELDRVRMVREIISEYEEELGQERVRLEGMRVELAKSLYVADELAKQGDGRKAQVTVQDIQSRIEFTEDEIDRMEQLLAVFRRKLSELQRVA